MSLNKVRNIIVFLVSFLFISISAQNDTLIKKWNYNADLYMMFPNIEGDIGIKNMRVASVDSDVNDVLGHLKMGAMFYLEATNNNWTLSSDFLYMKLEQDLVPKMVITGGTLVVEETAWELAGLKKVKPWLDLGFGARLINIHSEVSMFIDGYLREDSSDRTWIDPLIITRLKGDFSAKLFWQLRGDFGGVYTGSDFTWQIQSNIGYKFSKLFQTSIGYRYLSISYDKGDDGGEQFLYNVDTFGAVIRFGFSF